jgi:DNA-binding NarL/FixJ family response regulator
MVSQDPAAKLSPRRVEIYRLVSLGCERPVIAAILGISQEAFNIHRAAVMKAVGTNKAALLARLAIKHKVSKLDDELSPSEKRAGGILSDYSLYRYRLSQRPELPPQIASVVRLISLGCTAKDIGDVLDTTPAMARNYRMHALHFLGATNATTLTRLAITWKFTTMRDRLTAAEKRVSGRKNDGWN